MHHLIFRGVWKLGSGNFFFFLTPRMDEVFFLFLFIFCLFVCLFVFFFFSLTGG